MRRPSPLLLVFLLPALSACGPALPSLDDRPASAISTPASDGGLADAIVPLAARHAGVTGVHALADGAGAFGTRILLARAAEQSIDAQYYIWHHDLTGLLFMQALRDAADRGVRVRLLLDDNGIGGLDPIVAEMNAHPNVEVRLYNPFTVRNPKALGYLFDFFRLNHRMHNKSFTIDGLTTVVGGRNVGDEYFGTGPQQLYIDLDALAIGAVVPEVTADFHAYWTSASAYPAKDFVGAPPREARPLEDALAEFDGTPRLASYEKTVASSKVVSRMLSKTLEFIWTDVALVSDPPFKTLGEIDKKDLMAGRLADLMGAPRSRLDIVSPYFVPGEKGVEEFVAMEDRGVEVRVLTNSLDATDVLPVHAGYAKYREALLAGGVDLYELEATATPSDDRSDVGLVGSSSSSLHAKTFATDGSRVYIGSFNFDPRSLNINTEMGFLIDSEELAGRISEGFNASIADVAYTVELIPEGNIRWKERTDDGGVRVHDVEPNTGAWRRAAVTFLGWLPIQWLL